MKDIKPATLTNSQLLTYSNILRAQRVQTGVAAVSLLLTTLALLAILNRDVKKEKVCITLCCIVLCILYNQSI